MINWARSLQATCPSVGSTNLITAQNQTNVSATNRISKLPLTFKGQKM